MFLDNGIIYQVFVDRFAKGGSVPKRDDAVYMEWGDTPEYKRNEKGELLNNSLFGGTLWGVAEKLDYIESLGAGAIYLSPVCKSFSNHKYDTDDYLTVDQGFGGDEALQYLIDKAGERGIKIILDGVFNHVGEHSIYFKSALQNIYSPYIEWFAFTEYPFEYDCWWGCKNLPKTVKCSSFRDFICNQVIPKYMEMGIGGYRLDVVDEYSNSFTHQICQAVKKHNPHACIIGEVWEDASTKQAYGEVKDYFQGLSLDSVTNYPFRDGIIRFFRGGDNCFLWQVLDYQLVHYPKNKQLRLMNTLGTHDTQRIITALAGDQREMTADECAEYRLNEQQYILGRERLKAAYALLVSLPGTPCLYYGDEIGMEGKSDPFNRRTYDWENGDAELLAHFKALGSIRKNSLALTYGETCLSESAKSIFAFTRSYGDSKLLIVSFADNGTFPLNGTYKDIISGTVFNGAVFAEKPATFILQET